jgi:ATP phosphoribosyltransferase regulatory subunit HisZ
VRTGAAGAVFASGRRRSAMSLLDGILNQVSGTATVQNLAAKVGLTPEQVEQAVAALGQAHASEGDTVTTAAEQTGLPQDKLSEIVGHIGGEGALGRFASLLQQDSGGILGGFKKASSDAARSLMTEIRGR